MLLALMQKLLEEYYGTAGNTIGVLLLTEYVTHSLLFTNDIKRDCISHLILGYCGNQSAHFSLLNFLLKVMYTPGLLHQRDSHHGSEELSITFYSHISDHLRFPDVVVLLP